MCILNKFQNDACASFRGKTSAGKKPVWLVAKKVNFRPSDNRMVLKRKTTLNNVVFKKCKEPKFM